MRRALLILAAAALDWSIGDPESLPHPVRLTGLGITRLESLFYPQSGDSVEEFAAGWALAACITAAAYAVPSLLLRVVPGAGEPVVAVLLAATTLAARNLDDEARPILEALARHDLARARLRLARIVGRDTQHLDEAAVCRALIETLAESLSDGIVAPLFYLALGGVSAAMAFKAVSTMDSMIGHRTPRYLYFGRAAARLDDVANYLPARLTALAILACNPAAEAGLPARLRPPCKPKRGPSGSSHGRRAGRTVGRPEQLRGRSSLCSAAQCRCPAAYDRGRTPRAAPYTHCCGGRLPDRRCAGLCGRKGQAMKLPLHGGQLRAVAETYRLDPAHILDFSANHQSPRSATICA